MKEWNGLFDAEEIGLCNLYIFFYRQFDKVNQLRDSKIPVNETGEC